VKMEKPEEPKAVEKPKPKSENYGVYVPTWEELKLRILCCGAISMFISINIVYWYYSLMRDKSYNRQTWAPEMHFYPSEEDIYRVMAKYDYVTHTELVYVLILGTINIFFYLIFYMDLLTLLLPESISWLDILPIIVSPFDFLENALYFTIMAWYPDRIPYLATIAGILTLIKSILSYVIYFLLFYALCRAPPKLYRWYTERKKAKHVKKE